MKHLLVILFIVFCYTNCIISQNIKYTGYTVNISNKNLISDSEWSKPQNLDVRFKIKNNKITIKSDSIVTFILTNYTNTELNGRKTIKCSAEDERGIKCNVIIDINNIPKIYLFIFYSDNAFAYSLYSTKKL
ncbi:MAG: hypothetical protein A2X08_18080 [Bacteroidetes bacterium GWA2_32_17]|nr:MAG: hypothetical protein A2X08_18080 [Bacteroidetes bacterium GWA2_32_17]